jgi:periplasmic divalent cation tolerance protein
MTNNFCQLWLTCANKEEADKIANTLLVKHLVACAKQIPITADYWWQGKIEHADEVLLVTESQISLFDAIENEVTKLHSYETFVLESIAINKLSRKATSWLGNELNSRD